MRVRAPNTFCTAGRNRRTRGIAGLSLSSSSCLKLRLDSVHRRLGFPVRKALTLEQLVKSSIVLHHRRRQGDLNVRHGVHQLLRPPLVDQQLLGRLVPGRDAQQDLRLVAQLKNALLFIGYIPKHADDLLDLLGVHGLALRSAAMSAMPGKEP